MLAPYQLFSGFEPGTKILLAIVVSLRHVPITSLRGHKYYIPSYYSAQYICPMEKSGIFPSDHGIYPGTIGIKLDLCFCIIPTVGLYGKYGEISISLFITIY
jgi:hypothetical protein